MAMAKLEERTKKFPRTKSGRALQLLHVELVRFSLPRNNAWKVLLRKALSHHNQRKSLTRMSELSPPKKLRKGTKSCVECRRRKVGCIWPSDDARACRRCEERGCACLAQTVSLQTLATEGLTSRERIARLEQQVSTVTRALHAVESRLGIQLPLSEDIMNEDALSTQSDAESDVPVELAAAAPYYLRSLFENDLITSEDQSRESQSRKAATASLSFLRKARKELQRLIPPKEDMIIIARYADVWLSLYHALFPARSITEGGHELLSRHDEMQGEEIDAMSLAIWLVSVAITVQQVPEEAEDQLQGIKNPSRYCKAVSEAIEHEILVHDSLLGTLDGIETALHFLRLNVSRRNFKKMWLMLRRIIAVSELIGLPQASRTLEQLEVAPSQATNTARSLSKPDEVRLKQKAEAWTGICLLDRMSGMLLNLPSGTKGYPSSKQTIVEPNGRVITRAYLRNLSDIALQVHDLDENFVSETSQAQLYAEVLRMDRELTTLSCVPPKDWWEIHPRGISPDQMIQYWHHYVTMRTHFKFALRHDFNQQFNYSRYTCMNACRNVICRYMTFRPALPSGFFVGRIVDLQTLTAAVTILLIHRSSKHAPGSSSQWQSIDSPSPLITQLVETMESISAQKGSDFARQAIVTIRSLKDLLEDDDRSQMQDLTLRVPLLGKIHIRKNNEEHQNRRTIPFDGAADKEVTNLPTTSNSESQSGLVPLATNVATQTLPITNTWPWDPLSWSIEDDMESLFQSQLMSDDFGQMDTNMSYSNFHFNS